MTPLYISDLDGTLLHNDGTLSQPSKSTLQRLIQDGLNFSVASARSVVSMQTILEGLHLDLPIIEFNGAFVSDLQTGHHHIVNSIQSGIAEDVFGAMTRRDQTPLVSTFDGVGDRLYYHRLTNEGESWYVDNRIEHGDNRLCRTEDLAGSLREQVVCLTAIGRSNVLDDLEIELSEKYEDIVEIHNFENGYSPGWHWLTVHDKYATKDQAIRSVMEMCDLEDHELVVFGDEINDIKMFRSATHSIAVSNANDEVKRHATEVIGANCEDAVTNYIQRDFASRRVNG